MITVRVQNEGEPPVTVKVPEGKCPFEIMALWQKSVGLVPAAKDPAFDAMMAKRKEQQSPPKRQRP